MLAPIPADVHAAVVSVDEVIAVARVNPKKMVVHVHIGRSDGLPVGPTVGGVDKRNSCDVKLFSIRGVHLDQAEIISIGVAYVLQRFPVRTLPVGVARGQIQSIHFGADDFRLEQCFVAVCEVVVQVAWFEFSLRYLCENNFCGGFFWKIVVFQIVLKQRRVQL